MKLNFTVEAKINIPKHMRKIQDDDFWRFAAGEWNKLYTKFVPKNLGPLSENVRIRPKECEHVVPYSKKAYESDFNFRKDKHPLASRYWDKAAKPTEEPKLIGSMQKYIDSGRLHLDD